MGDYRIRTKNIIKWYEYQMVYPDAEAKENESESDLSDTVSDISSDNTESIPVSSNADGASGEATGDEEIDLATTGLDDDEQALVMDIMARFKEAKDNQSNIDSLFASSDGIGQ